MSEVDTYKFAVGDGVIRRSGVYADGPIQYGVVIRRYSREVNVISENLTFGPYPELYEVQWDNGKISDGYLPHGLCPYKGA